MNYNANKNSLAYYEMENWYNENESYSFQVVSRNNDVNGNPYRLVIVYDSVAFPVACYEARSSSPNIEYVFYRLGNFNKLLTLHVAPAEYNRLKRSFNNWRQKNSDHVIGVKKCD